MQQYNINNGEIMKSATQTLIDHLNTSDKFILADLYVITLTNSTVLRLTNFDINLTYDSNTYTSSNLERDKIKQNTGFSVDSLDFIIYSDSSIVINGFTFNQALHYGLFDGAKVQIYKAYLNTDYSVIGAINLFYGSLSINSITNTKAELQITSITDILNTKLPRNLYQAACSNTLFDTACSVQKSTYKVSGIAGPECTKVFVHAGLLAANNYFNQGVILFTSGQNINIKRTVKKYAAGNVLLIKYLPYTPAEGDTFDIWPGCDKTKATCQGRFNNLTNFRGFPFIPRSETVL
jgi:uncharacterized phage protein (TIGR02218 family)